MDTSSSHTPHAAGAIPSRAYALASSIVRDRVVLAFIAGLALLLLLDSGQARHGLDFTIDSFIGILPFLLVAVMLAALTRATGADRLIARAFVGHPARAVVIAALAGALSPFCSCGVVPIIAALLRARVPLAPVMAFWIASPIMDPEMFVLTAAGISMEFALAKTAVTITMGLVAGYSIHLLRDFPGFTAPLRPGSEGPSCSSALPSGPVQWRFWSVAERRTTFRTEFLSTAVFLGKWLLLAFFVESLMVTYIPADRVTALLGSGSWYEIPLAAAAGVPAYLNGYAAIPLMAGLLDMGMSPGAAMAFMTAGGVSSIPAAMAVAVLVRRPVFAAYITLGLLGSMGTALLYAWLS